ncbi:hypothetical protein ACIPQA_33875, partial [Streptomyces sp. NPDC090109]|uniref:hypothetical protein n=1 Tax=Streptomyces sp. NPDC090109 TaxID=3365948 RepID=UPI003824BC7A
RRQTSRTTARRPRLLSALGRHPISDHSEDPYWTIGHADLADHVEEQAVRVAQGSGHARDLLSRAFEILGKKVPLALRNTKRVERRVHAGEVEEAVHIAIVTHGGPARSNTHRGLVDEPEGVSASS